MRHLPTPLFAIIRPSGRAAGAAAASRWALLAALVVAFGGCVEFNECAAESGARLGAVALDLDIRRNIVRTQETPVGNLVADALYATARAVCADDAGAPCPDFALQNAGGIREETACGTRETIQAGNIYESDIADLLAFENEIVVVRLTGRDVRLGLERSVSQIGQVGDAAAAGYFVVAAGLSFDVSCSGATQTLDADGASILNPGGRISNIALTRNGDTDILLDDDTEYEVAMNAFMASGNDGFLAFLLRDGENVVFDDQGTPVPKMNFEQDRVRTTGGTQVTDRNALEAYIEASERSSVAVGRPTEGRIRINDDCFANPNDL